MHTGAWKSSLGALTTTVSFFVQKRHCFSLSLICTIWYSLGFKNNYLHEVVRADHSKQGRQIPHFLNGEKL